MLLGTFASNAVMFFIILTAAITLHANGIGGISSSREAMAALEPLAGRFAAALYAMAIIGVGLLAEPTLSGAAAYALADSFRWKQWLYRRLRDAPAFYGVVLLASLGGVALDFLDVDPMGRCIGRRCSTACWRPSCSSACCSSREMPASWAGQPATLLSRVVVLLTVGCMLGAAAAMFLVRR